MLLKGAGGFTLAIPLLPSLLPRQSWAQTTTPLKRYFSFVGTYDYGHHQHWFPTLAELPFTHDPTDGDQRLRYQTLRSFISPSKTELSRIIGGAFNPYLDKMNVFRALNLHTRIAHGRGHMLGNVAATDGHDSQVVLLKPLPTIDRLLASDRNFNPSGRSPLHFGQNLSYFKNTDGTVSRNSASWESPHAMFARLFNGVTEGGGQQTQTPHPRRDILSRVYEDYRRVSRGRQISAVDKQILENAMSRYSDIQARLAGTTTTMAGCSYSGLDPAGDANSLMNRSRTLGVNPYSFNPESHGFIYDLYAQIYAAAASCDLHRVFSFHTSIQDHFDRHPTEDFHQGHSHQPWTNLTINGTERANHSWMAEVWRLYATEFVAKLAGYLNSYSEANGRTILDNSLVHMTLEASHVHGDFSKPCLFIGGAGGALTTGHFIDYSRRELGPHAQQGDGFSNVATHERFGHCYHGLHYNRSLTTILQAMGLEPNQYEDPAINGFFQARTDGLLGAHNNGVSRVGGYGHIGSETSGVWYLNNSQLYSQEYARANYHFYKNALPLPPTSST